jgi:polyphosphate glucokinase
MAAKKAAKRAARAAGPKTRPKTEPKTKPKQKPKPTANVTLTVPAKRRGGSVGPYTLAVDIGGSGLKASVLDAAGNMTTERVRIQTPDDCPPKLMLEKLKELVALVPSGVEYERISVGFPGVVRGGRILTAHNLGTEAWYNFDLARALEKNFGKPVRVANDADIQGLAAVNLFGGEGVEVVITLGTGVGSSLFQDGVLAPHLELAHHPFRKGQTYEEQLGDVAFKEVGKRRWNRRLKLAIETLRRLTTFDRLYLGGGNAANISLKLPADVAIIPNKLGMIGGAWLWEKAR